MAAPVGFQRAHRQRAAPQCLSAFIVLAWALAAAATGASADRGRELVEENCAACHTRDGFAMPGEPPTLSEIARQRHWPGGELNAWLATDHARIATPRLTSREFYEMEQYLDALSREFPEF